MAFFVRLCDDYGESIGCFEKSFFRNLVALFIAAAAFAAARRREGRGPLFGSSPRRALVGMLLRSSFGAIGIFANFYALSRIPIGEAMTLNKTAPFFTVLFSAILLGERVRLRQAAALVAAFGGAMMVMKPGFHPTDAVASSWALAGGLGAGLAYVCVHALGRLKVSPPLIVLFFSAFSTVASVPPMIGDFRPMTFAQVAIMLGAGVGAAIGQFGVTAAYRYAEPRQVAVFDYSNVIFTALFGLVFFDQVPDALSALGFAVICLAACALRK